jgi:hypothetical protein
MISCIINKEFKVFNSNINILLSKTDDRVFVNYLKNIFDTKSFIFSFESTYYGHTEPHIIICNHRLTDLTKSIEAAKFFHCGLLIVDTDIKPDLVANRTDNVFTTSPVLQIALSNNIYYSWNKIHDYVLDIDTKNIGRWQNTIYNLCKEKFTIKNDDQINIGK